MDAVANLVLGWLGSVVIEGPIVYFGLSREHPRSVRLFLAGWLTACTYPLLAWVYPALPGSEGALWPAEAFVCAAECALAWFALHRGRATGRRSVARDLLVVALANLASWQIGALWLVRGE